MQINAQKLQRKVNNNSFTWTGDNFSGRAINFKYNTNQQKYNAKLKLVLYLNANLFCCCFAVESSIESGMLYLGVDVPSWI